MKLLVETRSSQLYSLGPLSAEVFLEAFTVSPGTSTFLRLEKQ